MKPPSTARTAGRSGGCGGACDASPLSCFLFRPRKTREKHRKALHKTPTQHAQSLTISAVIFILIVPFQSCFGHSPTNGSCSLSLTHSPSPAKSYTAAHRGKQGVLLHGAALSFLGCQKAVGSQSESEETRACDDALQRAIVGPSRRSPAGLRCPVCNLAMLLFFCSARRASYTHKVKGEGSLSSACSVCCQNARHPLVKSTNLPFPAVI